MRASTSLLVVASLVHAILGCELKGPRSEDPDAWVTIRGQSVAVEVADTPEKQALGLGNRDELPWDHGMLFRYDPPSFQAFWMKRMRFPIDIIWILDGRIVKIDANVPFEPGGNGPTVRSGMLIDTVLEVPANYSMGKGWRVGDRVVVEPTRTSG